MSRQIDPGVAERARVHAALGDPARLALVESLLLSDLTPQEAGRLLDIRSNLLAHHVNVLEQAGLVSRSRSEGDGRRRYLRLRHDALRGLVRPPRMPVSSVLFVCTRNAARSQLATAMWPSFSAVPAESAGADPADAIAMGAVDAARRHGLPQLVGRPRSLAEVSCTPDLIVSLCDRANESGGLSNAHRLHWSIPDPVDSDDPAAFDRTVAELRGRLGTLAAAISRAA